MTLGDWGKSQMGKTTLSVVQRRRQKPQRPEIKPRNIRKKIETTTVMEDEAGNGVDMIFFIFYLFRVAYVRLQDSDGAGTHYIVTVVCR